jgi:hypothetical protein
MSDIIIGSGDFTFKWIDNWARIPETASGRENGRTHGVVVVSSGEVLVFNQADPGVLVYSPDGTLKDSWGDRFLGAHGMTLVQEGDEEFLWLTDQDTGEVVKTTLDGQSVLNLSKADHPIYETRKYIPTWVAVNEERFGGNGDVWVADGYGSFYCHRYDRGGRYLDSINGEEGDAGLFNCPHGLWTDTRRGTPELYVADRGNRRMQVYAMDGTYKREFGSDFFTSPDGSSSYGADGLLVPELFARIAILDADDNLVCYLGSNEDTCKREGWPNLDSEYVLPGLFNSPHGAVADGDGNIYVVEWIIGGRITKLERI